MKKTALGLCLILTLLFSAAGLILVDSAKANGFIPEYRYLPEIVINSDGTVTPETNLIKRIGLTYALTADVDGYAIRIERSNIVFDGAGHIINTTKGDSPGISLDDVSFSDVILSDVNNVTIKNLEVVGRYFNIFVNYSSNCLITNVKTNKSISLGPGSNFNTITKSNITLLSIYFENANNNRIIKNNISQLFIGSSYNFFSQNNFFLTALPLIAHDNFWDDGLVGNYWGNYSLKHRNASEIGNTGISDTPYIIERERDMAEGYPNATNVDNYPLMYPYDIEKDAIAFPVREPHPSQEPFPITFVMAVSVATVAVLGVGLLVYFKKRKR